MSSLFLANSHASGDDYVENTSAPTGSTNNLDADYSAPGASPINNADVGFYNESGLDFRLAYTDTDAKEAGANLTNDSDLPITDDIAGTSRPIDTNFDCGAHETGSTFTTTSTSTSTSTSTTSTTTTI